MLGGRLYCPVCRNPVTVLIGANQRKIFEGKITIECKRGRCH